MPQHFIPTVLLSQPQTIWKLEYSPDWPVRGIFNFQNRLVFCKHLSHYRGNSNRNSNDTHAQKYMKTHMFCKRLSYYRRNSNRNSNDTHAQKYMKTYMFCKRLSYYRGNSNRNSNDTHAQKYMKTHMFCKHLSYYRRNSNRNSNDTHAQKYMKRICFACIWVITEGTQTATQTTLTHRSIWKHICFSHYLRFYRGNSNRNSNPTQTHLIVKRTHIAVFELSETWDFIIFKRTSLKHPQSSKRWKKPCVSEF